MLSIVMVRIVMLCHSPENIWGKIKIFWYTQISQLPTECRYAECRYGQVLGRHRLAIYSRRIMIRDNFVAVFKTDININGNEATRSLHHWTSNCRRKGATTNSIMTFGIMTLSIMGLLVTLGINDTWHNNYYTMMSVVMLSAPFNLFLCLMSLCWVSLCWMPLRSVLLCWKPWRNIKAGVSVTPPLG